MALETITEINLDTSLPGTEAVHAKQYDTVRKVKAHLFDHNVKWLVPSSNYVAVVGFKKTNRVGGFYDYTEDGVLAVSVDSSDRSIITIALDRNTVTTPSTSSNPVLVEITFYDSISTGRLSTFSFNLIVEAAAVSELDLASNPYFNILAEDIKRVLEAEQAMTGLDATAIKVSSTATDLKPTVTGGPGTGEDYNIEFKIPQGDKGDPPVPTSSSYKYAVSTSGTTVPSASDFAVGTPPEKGKYYWTQVTTAWNSGGNSVNYFVSYEGMDGGGSTASEIVCTDQQTVQDKFDNLNFKIYDQASKIIPNYEESAKTATVQDIYTAMPDRSMAILHAGFLNPNSVPNVYGCVEIVKWSTARTWIYFHSLDGIVNDYTLAISNGTVASTWVKVKS